MRRIQIMFALVMGVCWVSLAQASPFCGPIITSQPQSQTACPGDPVAFTVAAGGSGVLTYQWYKDAAPMPGETMNTFSIDPISESDYGDYQVMVSDDCGSTFSQTVTLTRGIPFTITAQPVDTSTCTGFSADFTVTAQGTDLSYQWRRDCQPIPGATDATFSITAATLSDMGTYDCVVYNSCGSLTSDVASLTVNPNGFNIVSQPADATHCPGETAIFTTGVVTGSSVSFQWFKDGQPVNGATLSMLTIPNLDAGDAGGYYCRISNFCGTKYTRTATLSFYETVAITGQPVSLNRCPGASAVFTVEAQGAAPLSYQWRKDGINIAGATSASYTIAAVAQGDTASYDCVVSNPCGSTTSNTATLNVKQAASITGQPQAVEVCSGDNATFTVTATGTEPLSYQWYKDGAILAGEVNATLTIANVDATDLGNYSCSVSNVCGQAMSNNAQLSFGAAPTITVQPQDTYVCNGCPATLTVQAQGDNLTYQWRQDGTPIDGATSASYYLPSVRKRQYGNYDCVVTNACGSTVSQSAELGKL